MSRPVSPSRHPSQTSDQSINLNARTSLLSQSLHSGSYNYSDAEGINRDPSIRKTNHVSRTPSLATVARDIAQGNFGPASSYDIMHTDNSHDEVRSRLTPSTCSSDEEHTIGPNGKASYATFSAYNTYDKDEQHDCPSQTSRRAAYPAFPGGIIRFLMDGEDTKNRYFVVAQKDANMDDVARFMAIAWHRKTPNLVLSIISSSRYFVPWSKEQLGNGLRDGIIQAANSTEMWLLTDGLDFGVSKVVGDAAHIEMVRRKSIYQNPLHIQNIATEEKLPRLNIFGICSKSSIVYAEALSGDKPKQAQSVVNGGCQANHKLYDLNPDHTHFILLDDGELPVPGDETQNAFRMALEWRFTKPVGRYRRYHAKEPSVDSFDESCMEMDSMVTPVVGLLVQGGPPDIDHILWLLKKKIPVVVIKGSGLAADLVAFAYTEMEQKSDPEYMERYIKAELMRRVSDAFPDDFVNDKIARNLCRDRIIECVKLNSQDNLSFLTTVNSDYDREPLKDIGKYLLSAIFKSQSRLVGIHWREQLQWDLQLTVDWNRPDLARTEIFNKYNLGNFKVAEPVVHRALLRPNREEFVELFLEHGLQIHTYLNHKRLNNLFAHPQDKDFFISVCMEGVLGKTVNPANVLCSHFVDDQDCQLNRLLYKCTGLVNLVNPYELSMNSLKSYVTDKEVAERRATNTLVLWAVLTNRYKLAKLLWKRTEDPMAVGLVVSMILHRLATEWCKKDLDMRQHLKEVAAEFGKMSVNLLRLSYQESSMYTFAALSKKLEDFNNKTVVELARLSNNKHFIAHHCCQKWLTQRWFGKIHIREVDWGANCFKLPDGLKIYLSAFFVFPMFFWISCQPSDVKSHGDEDEDEVLEDAQEMSMLLRVTSMEEKMHYAGDKSKTRRKSRMKMTINNMLNRGEVKMPIWKQIFFLWSAPITKFWLNQLSSFLFLIVMSWALLMPGCGDFNLDLVVLTWTVTNWIEIIRHTYLKRKLSPEVSLYGRLLECVVVLVFMVLMLTLRVVPHFFQFVTFMSTKFFMSIYLLFFYFRFMYVSVPVSPTLGPMLVSIIIMVKKDFVDWMRLFLLVLVSGAITIQAVIYPSFPFGLESLRQAFSRAIFGLFLTKIDDLDGFDCSSLYEDPDIKYCQGPNYYNKTVQDQLAKCPHASLLNYVIVIPYLLNAKLIFITLLYAMFATTCAKVYNYAVEIWKYQRYGMILDFEKRLILPPPLSLLVYLFYFLQWLGRLVYHAVALLCAHTPCCGPKADYKDHPTKIQIVKFRRTADYNYWKECINRYTNEEREVEKEANRPKVQSDCLNRLLEEMKQQQILTRGLNDRMVVLETNFTNSCLLLEEMKHMIKRLDPATQVMPLEPKKLIHVLARQSPYKQTMIRRFPVFDKYVPWEVPYDQYDPSVHSKPKNAFHDNIKIFVDPDLLAMLVEQNRRNGLTPEELVEVEELETLPEFKPVFNSVTSGIFDGLRLELDRTSWISMENQPLRYKLDTLSIPMNPLGRTGMRGRGRLWRFGPNHRISAVVSRWRRRYSPLGYPMDHMLVDGKRVLECIVVERRDSREITLPGGNVYGKTTCYSVMCEEFLTSVFKEEEVEGSLKLDQDDMISYFAQFARSPGTQHFSDPRADMAASGFSASIVYRGYIDDSANTDNAWREAEVWNFHYDLQDMFDDKIKDRDNVWREITPYMRLYGNQDSIVMEAARIHNACH